MTRSTPHDPPQASALLLDGRLVTDSHKFEVFARHYMSIMVDHKKKLREHIIKNDIPRRSRRLTSKQPTIYYPRSRRKIKRSNSELSCTSVSTVPTMRLSKLRARRCYETKKAFVYDPQVIEVSDDEDEETKPFMIEDIPTADDTPTSTTPTPTFEDDDVEEINKTCVRYVPHGYYDDVEPERDNIYESQFPNGHHSNPYGQFGMPTMQGFRPPFVNPMEGYNGNECPPYTAGPGPQPTFEGIDPNFFSSFLRQFGLEGFDLNSLLINFSAFLRQNNNFNYNPNMYTDGYNAFYGNSV